MKEHDPESDPADEVNFHTIDLDYDPVPPDSPICPKCSWELDEAGDCPNPGCDESPNYDEEEDDEELDA